MHTFNLNPLVITNENCKKTPDGTLVENGINELDAIVTCFKELLTESINFRSGNVHKINPKTSVELIQSKIIFNASFDTLEELGEDAKACFEIPELLNHLLHTTQQEILEPLEQKNYKKVQIGLRENVFGKNIKKIISQANESKNILEAAGVLDIKGKGIDLDKFVEFDYEVESDEIKIKKKADIEIVSIDIIEKNSFVFKILDESNKFRMSASPNEVVKIAKWVAKKKNEGKAFFAKVEFEYLFHLRDTYSKCNLMSMKLKRKKDHGEQQDAFEKEKQEEIEKQKDNDKKPSK